jgi:hypothetical protein
MLPGYTVHPYPRGLKLHSQNGQNNSSSASRVMKPNDLLVISLRTIVVGRCNLRSSKKGESSQIRTSRANGNWVVIGVYEK